MNWLREGFGGKLRRWIIGSIGLREGSFLNPDTGQDLRSQGAATLPRGEGEPSSITEWEAFHDLLDDRGNPRLSCARSLFLYDLDQEAVPLLAEAFRFWRDHAEYLLLKGENRVNGKELFLALKCSKRGNDVFSRRLDQKLGFLSRMEGIQMFTPEDFKPNKVVRSNLLWVTLTYNPALGSLKKAWETYMEDWNLWITNLRNRYGKIAVLRFSEAFPDQNGEAFGYPHIHAVLLFKEAQFKVFPRMEEGRDGKLGLVYRIQEKFEVESQGRWHSWIDVKALSSGRALGGYLRKHTKNTHYGDDQGALVTQALLWLHRKQTFSMSSGFRENFLDLIMTMHDSKTSWAQKTLDGQLLDDWIWSCHGVRSAGEVGVDPGIWVVSLEAARFYDLVDPGGGR
jgi:hypothetical protein